MMCVSISEKKLLKNYNRSLNKWFLFAFLEYIVKIKNCNTVCRFSNAVQPHFANFKLNKIQYKVWNVLSQTYLFDLQVNFLQISATASEASPWGRRPWTRPHLRTGPTTSSSRCRQSRERTDRVAFQDDKIRGLSVGRIRWDKLIENTCVNNSIKIYNCLTWQKCLTF